MPFCAFRGKAWCISLQVIHSDYNNKDFQELCIMLDKFQNNIFHEREGLGFTALAGLEKLHDVLMVYDGEKPIACGALKKSDENSAEITRIYTDENYRGQGIGKMIVEKLERIAVEKGYTKLVLDTWKKSASARALYEKMGYCEVPPLRNAFSNYSFDVDDKLQQIQDMLVFMEKEIEQY